MSQPLVAIIVLNYKTYNLTLRLIDELFFLSYKEYVIIIIDNNSPNNSASILEEKCNIEQKKYGSKIHFVKSNFNGGYSYGNNLGTEKAKALGAKYIVILNNDVLLVNKNFLERAIEYFENNETVAMIGPQIIENGVLQVPAYKKRPSCIGEIAKNLFLPFFIVKNKIQRKYFFIGKAPVRVFSIAGCCMILRLDYFCDVGYFDEGVFLYGEEVILGEKFLKRKYEVWILPEILIDHAHSSTIKEEFNFIEQENRMLKSRIYYYEKYRNAGFLCIALIKLSVRIRNCMYIPIIKTLKRYFY